jgi:hypothetical protein
MANKGAEIIQISQAQQLQAELQRANDSITHFLNEQIRDAVEAIEGEILTDVIISSFGRINHYQDGTREFIWKDVPVLVVRYRMNIHKELEVYAQHNYNDAFEITQAQADAKVDGLVQENDSDDDDDL